MIFILPGCDGTTGHEEHGQGHEHEHGEGEESGEVELTQAQMNAVGIRLGTFEARVISETVRASGRLEISAASEGIVAPAAAGKVSRLLVSEGKYIKAGEVVAWMEAPEIITIRQQIAEARQEVDAAQVEVTRQEALAAQGAGIRKNLDNARAVLQMARLKLEGCKKQLSVYGLSPDSKEGTSFPVKSGVSGVVTSIEVAAGGYADMQTPILKVVNNDAVYCMLQVPEKDISGIKVGMDVDMQLTNDPSHTFIGKVEKINPVMDMETHTIPVKVTIAGNTGSGPLIPGMAVSAGISTGGTSSTALPDGAIVASGGKSYIFVLESESHDDEADEHEHEHEEKHSHEGTTQESYHFKKIEVATGPTALGWTAVTPLQELPADARVVVSGAFYLNSMISDHGEHNH